MKTPRPRPAWFPACLRRHRRPAFVDDLPTVGPWSDFMRSSLALLVLLIAGSVVLAVEPLHVRIDTLVAAGMKDFDKVAAPVASDAEFLRRATLDLTGRIPSATEARTFLDDKAADKRTKVIDRLLASPKYARRMQEYWDVVLMDRRRDVRVPRAAWEDYLRTSFAENKPFDQLVREMLSADGSDPKTRPASKFLLDRTLDPTMVTRDISRLFLGMNLQCAQCHDHPLVEAYKQEHFYGIQAFFTRAFLFPDNTVATAVIAEKGEGDTTFTSVFDKSKAIKNTAPRMPGLKPLSDPKLEKGKEYKVPPAKGVKPIPNHSRFSQLAAAITDKDNVAFRRTAANRLWAMMLGRGIVHPMEFDHPENPPSHPALLNLLGEELVAHKFDVKWLVREIALSKTYQRSSELSPGLEAISPSKFAVAQLKPLSPEQFGYAIMQATDAEPVALAKGQTEVAMQARLAGNLVPFRSMFGTRPGEPEDGYAATLDQTLFLKHGNLIRTLIAQRAGNLLDRATKIAGNAAIADELFLSVYTRPASAEEKIDVADALKGQSNRPAALAEIIWAMLASAEFRFNH